MAINDTKFTIMHQLDLDRQNIIHKPISEEDAFNYVRTIVKNVLNNKNKRHFGLNDDLTAAILQIKKVIREKEQKTFRSSAESIAERLLRIELKTQEKVKQITKLKKGSLVQSFFNSDENIIYLIAKIEHNQFLDERELKKRAGMPYDKIALKTCLAIFDEDDEIEDILIHDTHSGLTRYWWDDFLELKEKNTDENNTKNAFNTIKKVLDRRVRRQSPSDYNILFNSLLRYFKEPKSFTLDGVIENVFGEYMPEEPEQIRIDEIKGTVRKLSEKKYFDTQFNIVPKEIKARKRTYNITSAIELKIKDNIENIRHIIKSEIDENNEKFIKIKTDNEDTFRTFKYTNKRGE